MSILLRMTLAFLIMQLSLPATGQPRSELSRDRFSDVRAEIQDKPNAVIVFGDSIVEWAPLPKAICGVPVINGGVAGVGIRYFQQHSAALLGSSRPTLIVLAVGINDTTSSEATQQFRSRYQETVTFLSSRAPVILATVTPVWDGPAAAGYKPIVVPLLNEMIRSTVGARKIAELNEPLAKTNRTIDGVHLSADGYVLWLRAIVQGIEAALDCTA